MSQKQGSSASLMMLTVSMIIYGTIGIFRRHIPLSSGVLACARGFLGSAFLLIFLKLRGRSLGFRMAKRDMALFILSGAMIGVNWILLFEAYNYTTVATATLCYYMQPTIVILLSPLLLNEKLTAKKALCAAAAIVGMALVTGIFEGAAGGSGSAGGQFKGILLGLGAAALYAAVIILNKKSGSADAYEKTILQLFSAAAVLVPYLLLTGQLKDLHPDGRALVLLAVVGIVHTGIAYALYFGSMDGLPGQTIALFSYIDPVVALLLSAFLLREPVTAFGIAGAVLILGAAVVSEI